MDGDCENIRETEFFHLAMKVLTINQTIRLKPYFICSQSPCHFSRKFLIFSVYHNCLNLCVLIYHVIYSTENLLIGYKWILSTRFSVNGKTCLRINKSSNSRYKRNTIKHLFAFSTKIYVVLIVFRLCWLQFEIRS